MSIKHKQIKMKGGNTNNKTKPSNENIDRAKQYIARFNNNSITKKLPRTIYNTNYKALQELIPHLEYLQNKYSNPGVFARMFKSRKYNKKLNLTQKALTHARKRIDVGKTSKAGLQSLQGT